MSALHFIPVGEFSREIAPISPLTALSAACLDAPLVAVAWQWLIADTFQARISIADRAVLFITAWVIYLIDRLGDSLVISASAPVSIRQKFCAEHRRRWLLLVGLLALLDAFLGFAFLDWLTIASGAVVGFGIAIYFAVNHFAGFIWRKLPIKELLIGFLFALGTVSAVHRFGFSFVVAMLLFGTLCSLNCLSISVWERELDIAQRRVSFATAHPGLVSLPRVACCALAGLALIMAILGQLTAISISVAISAVLLAVLHRADFLARDTRVAAADLVLLTPFIFPLIRLPA